MHQCYPRTEPWLCLRLYTSLHAPQEGFHLLTCFCPTTATQNSPGHQTLSSNLLQTESAPVRCSSSSTSLPGSSMGYILSKCDFYPSSCVHNFTLVPFYLSVDDEIFKIANKTLHDLLPPLFPPSSHSPLLIPFLLSCSPLCSQIAGYPSASGPLHWLISLLQQGEPAAPPKLALPHLLKSLLKYHLRRVFLTTLLETAPICLPTSCSHPCFVFPHSAFDHLT